MTGHKRTRSLLLSIGVFSLIACRSDQTTTITGENPPSRYDLITAGKILPETDDYPPIWHTDGWDLPHPINGAVNSAGLEDSPFITPDGKTMFFFYTPSSYSPSEEQISDQVTGIYFSERLGDMWQEPERVRLTEDTDLALDGCPFYQDNNIL